MGRRAWSPQTEDEAEKLTLAELNTRIAAAAWSLGAATSSQSRKLSFKTLTRLEKYREELHGIPAPDRSEPSRQR